MLNTGMDESAPPVSYSTSHVTSHFTSHFTSHSTLLVGVLSTFTVAYDAKRKQNTRSHILQGGQKAGEPKREEPKREEPKRGDP